MPSPSPARYRHVTLLGLLLLLTLLVKSPIWRFSPQIFNDSPGYLVPALGIVNLTGYGAQENAFRAPTYPLFLAAALAPLDRAHLSLCKVAHDALCIGRAAATPDGALDLRLITILQVMIGLLTLVLLYSITWKMTGNYLASFLAACGYALNISTAFWEISILTETLTTFLLVLSIYLTLFGNQSGRRRVALGVALAALALCHPIFLLYWALPALLLLLRGRTAGWQTALTRLVPVVAVPVASLAIWCGFNWGVNGVFSPSTIGGYTLINMVAPVIENAPPGYEDVTEIFIGYRDALVAETGSYTGAIFRAWPAMLEQSGWTYAELSGKLTSLSVYLIVAYPESYLHVVGQSAERFWGFPFYHYEPIPPGPSTLLEWFTDSDVQLGLDLLFWLSAPALAVLWLVRRRRTGVIRIPPSFDSVLFVMATVYYAATVVSFTNLGDNARYHTYELPLQYATILFIIVFALRFAAPAKSLAEPRVLNPSK